MRFVKLLQSRYSNLFKNNPCYSHMPTDSLFKTHLKIRDRPMYRLTKVKFYCLPQRFPRKKLGSEIVAEFFFAWNTQKPAYVCWCKGKECIGTNWPQLDAMNGWKIFRSKDRKEYKHEKSSEKKNDWEFFWEMRTGSMKCSVYVQSFPAGFSSANSVHDFNSRGQYIYNQWKRLESQL